VTHPEGSSSRAVMIQHAFNLFAQFKH
jgi:hypothetical protein